MVLDGAMDGDAFRAYLEQILAPCLRPGDVVVMDNLSAHKVAGVRQAIKARGAFLLYLPAYSPDLNPIEQAFGQAQGATPKGRRPIQRGALASHRRSNRPGRPNRMSKLLPQRRIWVQINLKCSSHLNLKFVA